MYAGSDQCSDKGANRLMSAQAENLEGEIRHLSWLADAPLFIDSRQIEGFYDAVVRPEYQGGAITISSSYLERIGTEKKISGGIKIALLKWFPFLSPEIGADVERTKTKEEEQAEELTIELRPVDSPHRRLIHLAFHYEYSLPDRRAVYSPDMRTDEWESRASLEAFIQGIPRALSFIELPPETYLMPTAAEITDGRVVRFFDVLGERIAGDPAKVPRYPRFVRGGDAKERAKYEQERSNYWNWFEDNFSPRMAIEIVEDIVAKERGRIRWIDYRILNFEVEDLPLHLHVVGSENFDTGVFAYNIIGRGAKHGLRIVGTLKSEPDINVLAVFEK